MTPQEFRDKLGVLGAIDAFERNLWHEWQETLEEHVFHMNTIGVSSMYEYTFMAFKWDDVTEGFEYWYAIANAFGRTETTLITIDGNDSKKNDQDPDHRGQE